MMCKIKYHFYNIKKKLIINFGNIKEVFLQKNNILS